MPTLTFYVTDDVAMQLEKVIKKQSERLGFVVSRGDILVPHIKKLYQREYPKNGNTPPVMEGAVEVNNSQEER